MFLILLVLCVVWFWFCGLLFGFDLCCLLVVFVGSLGFWFFCVFLLVVVLLFFFVFFGVLCFVWFLFCVGIGFWVFVLSFVVFVVFLVFCCDVFCLAGRGLWCDVGVVRFCVCCGCFV